MKELHELPEMAALKLKPFVKSPKLCPKCGRGPIGLPAWFIRTFDLPWSRFDIGYCRGGLPVSVEHDMGPFGKHEHQPICAGVAEPHLHVVCSCCKHSYLMETANVEPREKALSLEIARVFHANLHQAETQWAFEECCWWPCTEFRK